MALITSDCAQSVNESEVRSLIAEYVDSSGITNSKTSKESDSVYEDDDGQHP